MKRIKKYLIVIIMLVIVMCLTGCSKDENGLSKSNNLKTTSESSNENSGNNTNSSGSSGSQNDEIDIESIDFVASAEKQLAQPQKGETIAILHIKNYGDIKVKFFKDIAPKAVENFVTHAKDGYYNGQIFHRVINDFMIQGGDPTGTGFSGESIWGEYFEDEFSYDLVPYRGALCMANGGSNTNGSQFFIEQANYSEKVYNSLKQYGYPENLLEAYKKYGGSMHLFAAHTVFGQVIEGMDVVDKIAATKTDEGDRPVEDVVIESIEVAEF